MSPQLPSSVTSIEDLKGIIMEIQAYARWFAAASIKQRVAARSVVASPPTLSAESIALIKTVSSQQLTSKNLELLVAHLQNLVNTSPQLTITLAAPASASLKRDLVAWCREHIASSVLVNFRFNATILGGMVVQYGSHVYDWSFRRQILANRGHFPEVLRRV